MGLPIMDGTPAFPAPFDSILPLCHRIGGSVADECMPEIEDLGCSRGLVELTLMSNVQNGAAAFYDAYATHSS
jgi:hypothetical protein